jgi:hypothetical protein
MKTIPKCRGIWGILFGHKFGHWDVVEDYCLRCGMERGTVNEDL